MWFELIWHDVEIETLAVFFWITNLGIWQCSALKLPRLSSLPALEVARHRSSSRFCWQPPPQPTVKHLQRPRRKTRGNRAIFSKLLKLETFFVHRCSKVFWVADSLHRCSPDKRQLICIFSCRSSLLGKKTRFQSGRVSTTETSGAASFVGVLLAPPFLQWQDDGGPLWLLWPLAYAYQGSSWPLGLASAVPPISSFVQPRDCRWG